ncbi:helix-turn-helix transcriptional regulator [Vreelandella sulfidaeris]
MSDFEKERYLRLADVCERYSISRSTWWRWINTEDAPKPVRIGPRAVRWPLRVLLNWENGK